MLEADCETTVVVAAAITANTATDTATAVSHGTTVRAPHITVATKTLAATPVLHSLTSLWSRRPLSNIS